MTQDEQKKPAMNNSMTSSVPLTVQSKVTNKFPEFKGINPDIYCNTFSDNPQWTTKRSNTAAYYIRYSDLNGGNLSFMNPDRNPLVQDCKTETKPFIRFRILNPIGKQKYSQPQGSPQFPFLTGLFDFKVHIDMSMPLVLVEGEKKAYVLCSRGIPAIGVTGINGFYRYYSELGKYKIAPGYLEIPGLMDHLMNHSPGLVLLHDADALEGSRQRKYGFFGSIKAFKILFPNLRMKYAMVKPSSGGKGIDDAYLANPNVEFKDLVDSYPLNTFDQLEEIRKLFSPSVGAKNWDALNKVLCDLGLSFRWNTRKYLLECSKNSELWHTVGNVDADICRELQLAGVNIGTIRLNEMLRSSSIAEPFDTVTSFFHGLPYWDGTDYISQLCEHIQLSSDEDPEYFYLMLKKQFIRTVRCALEQNNVNRVVLVLHGRQGIGKSEFWRWLTPTELYYEENIDSKNKDSLFPLAQFLVINLDDLDELAKKDVAHLKSYISKANVKQRPPFGRNIEEFTRIASFVGSTNKNDILSDDVNTRWIILKVTGFDWQGYTARIDPLNIWSQAYAVCKANNLAGDLSENEKKIQALRNTEFLENSVEREFVAKYFESGDLAFTLSSIMTFIQDNIAHKCNQYSLGRELKRLFGEPIMTRENGVKGRYYYLKLRNVEQMEQTFFQGSSRANVFN